MKPEIKLVMWSNSCVFPSLLSFLPPAFSERSQPPPFFPEWGKGIWPCKDRFGEWKKGKRNKRKSIAHCPLFSLWWVRSLLQKEGKGLGAAGSACPEPGPPPPCPGEGDSQGCRGERTPWGQQWALRGAGSTHTFRLPALSTLLLLASPRHLQQAEPRAAPSRSRRSSHSACSWPPVRAQRRSLEPWVGKIPRGGLGHHVNSCLKNPRGPRSLASYGPQGTAGAQSHPRRSCVSSQHVPYICYINLWRASWLNN